jgi:hypothetical protein
MSLFPEFRRKLLRQSVKVINSSHCSRPIIIRPAWVVFPFNRRLCVEPLESRRLLTASPLSVGGFVELTEPNSATQQSLAPRQDSWSDQDLVWQDIRWQDNAGAKTDIGINSNPHFFGSPSILAASNDPAPGELPWDPIQAEAHHRDLIERLGGNDNYVVDDRGNIVGINPFTQPTKDSDVYRPNDGSEPVRMNPFPPEQTFSLHSLPGASKTIYLDFDGHTTSGTLWNSQFTGGDPIVTSPFNFEGSSDTFTENELFRIQRIWERVAEDFLPFHVNVTTEEPPLNALRRINSSDTQWGIRVVIGPGTWFGAVGGVAYLNSFNWSSDTPTFVFSNYLGNSEKNIAEAISHEVGHTLGLNHDGAASNAYYSGHGSGATGWAPIMGVGYNRQLVQWSRGEYPDATNTENDLTIITTQNGFGYRADDHGNTRATATPLSRLDSMFFVEGIIERNTDVDFFSFSTTGGNTVINVDPFYRSPNLDILAKLYNSSGTLIASSNPVSALNASFFLVLPSGNFYLSVEGTGKPASGSDFGYSDYGSLGYYSIQAFIPQEPGSLIAELDNGVLTIADTSGATNDLSIEIANDLLTISDANERFDSVPNGATLSNNDRTLIIPISLISNSVVINLNEGNDTLTVGSWMGTGAPGLTVMGGPTADTVNFVSGFVPASDRHLQVSVKNIDLNVNALVVTTGEGTIQLSADDISIASSANLVAVGSSVNITPLTTNRAIQLGSKVIGTLSLTDSELSRIGGQSLFIGDLSSGEITISSSITRQDPLNIQLQSGGNIFLDEGSINTGGGTLLLVPGASPSGVKPKNGDTAMSASQLSVMGSLVLEINGTDPVIGYDRLNLIGAVDLTGTNLTVAGSFAGVTGHETFTIVSASNVIGTFSGLPNESAIEVNGKSFLITYSDTMVQLAPAPADSAITASYVFHSNSTFSAEGLIPALDTTKTLAREGDEPIQLTFDNLINSSRGINGLVFDIDGLPSPVLSHGDFSFQVSPQGAFEAANHPPADWQPAPVLPTISIIDGVVNRVVLLWPDNAINNRWLRITLLANPNTGLARPATYYIGHLLGETTGSMNDVYTVSFADISLIRGHIGQTVGVGNIFDIDKNGVISFADISAMRSNVGAQLTNITIPGFGAGMPAMMSSSSDGSKSDDRNSSSPAVEALASLPMWSNQWLSQPDQRNASSSLPLRFDRVLNAGSERTPAGQNSTSEPLNRALSWSPANNPSPKNSSGKSTAANSSNDTEPNDRWLTVLAVDRFFERFDSVTE